LIILICKNATTTGYIDDNILWEDDGTDIVMKTPKGINVEGQNIYLNAERTTYFADNFGHVVFVLSFWKNLLI